MEMDLSVYFRKILEITNLCQHFWLEGACKL